MKIRVLLADDHTIIREGLRILLNSQSDMEVVGTATNGREAIQLVDELNPDVVIMDISMPELNGIEAIERLMIHRSKLRVIVLSIHASKPYIARALHAGARGYLNKETAGLDVAEAVRAVYRGEQFLIPDIRDVLNSLRNQNNEANAANPLDRLSRREREVLQLVAEGKTSQEIGERLSVSAKTVDSYRSRLMSKIGVEDIAGLVKFAIQHGVISLD